MRKILVATALVALFGVFAGTASAGTPSVAYKTGDIVIVISGQNASVVKVLGNSLNSTMHGKKFTGRYGKLRAGWGVTLGGKVYVLAVFTRNPATANLFIPKANRLLTKAGWLRVQ